MSRNKNQTSGVDDPLKGQVLQLAWCIAVGNYMNSPHHEEKASVEAAKLFCSVLNELYKLARIQSDFPISRDIPF